MVFALPNKTKGLFIMIFPSLYIPLLINIVSKLFAVVMAVLMLFIDSFLPTFMVLAKLKLTNFSSKIKNRKKVLVVIIKK
jgi:hypothetical protein